MGMAEDVAVLLVDAGVLASANDLYIGDLAHVPDGDGPYLSFAETAGVGPEYVQDVGGVSMEMPGGQLVARALSYVDARTLARAAWAAFPQWNVTLNGTWYRSVRALQSPFPIGLDATQRRIRFAFNIMGDKKP